MRLQELLPPEHIVIGLEAADKWEVIDRLLEHLVARAVVPEARRRALQEAVLQRERSMSTGMERGIAIPHAAVDGLEKVVAAMGLVNKEGSHGVPFDSIDASPAWIVVLLLIPRQQKLVHIRTLADLARHLGNEETRRTLRAARDPLTAWKALARG